MKKFLLITLLAGIIIAGTILFIYISSRGGPAAVPTPIIRTSSRGGPAAVPTPTPFPITTIAPITAPNKFDAAPPAEMFSYAGPQLSLPTALPTYKISYPTNLTNQAAALAKLWGISAALTHPVPYVYDWIDTDKYLTYNDKDKSISFAFSNPENTAGSPHLVATDVINTLTSYSFLSADFVFTQKDRRAMTQAEGLQKTSPPMTATSYQTTIKNIPFLFLFSALTQSTSEIITKQDGSVISFAFYVTPTISKEGDRTLLPADQILPALNNQKGYLAGIGNTYSGYPFAGAPTFTSVAVSNISVGYLYVAEEQLFVPVYIVEGVGSGPSGNQQVRYLLRASS
jgi:hypothetical protein